MVNVETVIIPINAGIKQQQAKHFIKLAVARSN